MADERCHAAAPWWPADTAIIIIGQASAAGPDGREGSTIRRRDDLARHASTRAPVRLLAAHGHRHPVASRHAVEVAGAPERLPRLRLRRYRLFADLPRFIGWQDSGTARPSTWGLGHGVLFVDYHHTSRTFWSSSWRTRRSPSCRSAAVVRAGLWEIEQYARNLAQSDLGYDPPLPRPRRRGPSRVAGAAVRRRLPQDDSPLRGRGARPGCRRTPRSRPARCGSRNSQRRDHGGRGRGDPRGGGSLR